MTKMNFHETFKMPHPLGKESEELLHQIARLVTMTCLLTRFPSVKTQGRESVLGFQKAFRGPTLPLRIAIRFSREVTTLPDLLACQTEPQIAELATEVLCPRFFSSRHL